MLKAIFGSAEAEKALAFIEIRGQGYAYEMAKFYSANLYGIQKQLNRMEHAGLLSSKLVGRTRLYMYNPRYAFLKEVRALISKALTFYPKELQDGLRIRRERPRRQGKPL
jgi:hypothetical protein